MKHFFPFVLACFLASSPAWAQKAPKAPKPQKYDTLLTLSTQFGDIKFLLYEDTPLHRANFLKLVREKFYNDLLFHRVIKEFMLQGGDPESKNAKPDQRLGAGGGNMKRIPAEFRPNRFHKKGAIAAARDGNPEKASSACQFYIVQGKKFDENELKGLAQRLSTNYTDELKSMEQRLKEQLETYKTVGGTPFLDQNYTVYGEVIEGLSVIDEIAKQPTNPGDRPKNDIKMTISFKKMKKTDITKKYGYVYPETKK